MSDPTERFSDRADDYVRGRPDYPPALIELLEASGLRPKDPVADLGSGTGILAARLLDAGFRVFAVEPNAAMRAAAERRLGGREGFVSVDGTAERTGLPDASVAAVTAGQAFHWFDPLAARREVLRILRPNGFAAMVWNQRRPDADALHAGYEALLHRFGTDYAEVSAGWGAERALNTFFGPAGYTRSVFDNHQVLDEPGLRARLLSSSYTPKPGDPRHEPLLEALHDLFAAHQQDGHVVLRYHTEVYLGPVRA